MKSFRDVQVLKVVYNAYIRSHLDYCSSICSPSSKYLIQKVERVQRKFIKFMCFQTKQLYDSNDYIILCDQFHLTTLEHRRTVRDLTVFYKILHSKLDCPQLVSALHLNIPARRTRHTKTFTTVRKSRLVIRKNDFMPRTISVANSVEKLDFFDRRLSKSCISHLCM